MDIKTLIPKDKFDIETAKRLKNHTYEQTKLIIPELFTWLQDINWPVAKPVADYLLSISECINEDLLKVLQSDDDIWKYWCLMIFGEKSSGFDKYILDELVRIADNPSKGEIEEEVNILAKDLINNL